MTSTFEFKACVCMKSYRPKFCFSTYLVNPLLLGVKEDHLVGYGLKSETVYNQ